MILTAWRQKRKTEEKAMCRPRPGWGFCHIGTPEATRDYSRQGQGTGLSACSDFRLLAFRTCFKPCEFLIASLGNYYASFVILIFIFLLLDLNTWILTDSSLYGNQHIWHAIPFLPCIQKFRIILVCVCLIVFTSIRDQAFIYSPIPAVQVIARETQSRESEANLLTVSSRCSLWLTGTFVFLLYHFQSQKLYWRSFFGSQVHVLTDHNFPFKLLFLIKFRTL